MLVFPVGGPVVLLRFLPDGHRLLVGTGALSAAPVRFAAHPVHGGEPVPVRLPDLVYDDWYFSGRGSPVGFHPTQPLGLLAWGGRLHAFDPDTGGPQLAPPGTAPHQLALSPDGSRVLAAATRHDEPRRLQGTLIDDVRLPGEFPLAGDGLVLGGFLPGGDRFVTVEASLARVRSFATGEYLAAGRHKLNGFHQCTLSPCGRWLATLGYGSLDLCDLDALETKPRQIKGSSNFGDFRSVAFHPDGRRMAVIHGGPTLVKVYDTASLKQTAVFKWKLGPMTAVAFSPDGTLAAAGSDDGRVVVWDVED